MAGIVQYWERKNWFNPHIRHRWIFWVMMAFKKQLGKEICGLKSPPALTSPALAGGPHLFAHCNAHSSLASLLQAEKCYGASTHSCETDDYYTISRKKTNRRCSFQANGQKYPHLLPSCMATEVKGRCLSEPVVAASEDDELQTNLCKAPRDWSDRALSSRDPSNKLFSTGSWATFTWWGGYLLGAEEKIKANDEILSEINRTKKKKKGCNWYMIFCTLLSYLFPLTHMTK